MQANNVPTDAGDGIPPATWAVLWDKIKPLSVSVAKAMAMQFGNIGWADALKVSVDAHAEAAGNANELKRRVGTYADSPGRLYFLVVVNGRTVLRTRAVQPAVRSHGPLRRRGDDTGP